MSELKGLEELWAEVTLHPRFASAIIAVARDGIPGEVEILMRYTKVKRDGSSSDEHVEVFTDCMLDGALRQMCQFLGIPLAHAQVQGT